MNIQTYHLKYWFFVSVFCLSSISLLADDLTVDGKLTVTEDLKAGTDSAYTNFEFRNNGIIVSKGSYTGSDTLLGGDQGNGTRFLWYPAKAAFRAGRAAYWSWDDGSIGDYSVAFGYGTNATADYSTASGYMTYAQGLASVALGYGCYANGAYSAALGSGFASGSYSAAFNGGYASGESSVGFGSSTHAYGKYSAVFGKSTMAHASYSLVIGRYNVGECGTGGDTNWIDADPLFEVGNGSSSQNLSDAFVIYKNGDVDVQGIVTASPGGDIPMYQGQ